MRLGSTLALLVVCLTLHVSPGAAKTPERRVALVIGNAHYLHLPQLATPLDDAEAMATTLSRLGFNVRLEYDVSRQEFSDALRGIAASARGADIAIIYFAGTAAPNSSNGTSGESLLPVDAPAGPGPGTGPAEIQLSQVTNALSGAKTRLLFLDVVRPDRIAGQASPQAYPDQFARSVGRGVSVIVADQSLDAAAGAGAPLSPFTNALVETLPDPDLDLTEALRQITQRVLHATGGQQQVASVGKLPARGVHLAPPPGSLEGIVTLGPTERFLNFEASPIEQQHADVLRDLEVHHRGTKEVGPCAPQINPAAPSVGAGPQSVQGGPNCSASVPSPAASQASGGAPAPSVAAADEGASPAVGYAVPPAVRIQSPLSVRPWQLEEAPLTQYGASKLAPPKTDGSSRSPAATTAAPPIAALPEFPWPPPSPSAELVLPGRAIGPSAPPTLGAVADRLVSALQAADYLEYSFYHVPDGFALVARLERITADGRPMAAEFRYVPPDSSAPLSFSDYIRSLFFAPEGYYRLIAFVATDTPFVVAAATMNVAHAEALLRGGTNTLPAEWRAQPFTAAYAVTALIYEYRKGPQDGAVTTMIPSPLAAETHLLRAGIHLGWSAQP
ncbi:MAG TPA: caspase family protein [Acetobacteraceae bacterium]|jgi:hypothetical protein